MFSETDHRIPHRRIFTRRTAHKNVAYRTFSDLLSVNGSVAVDLRSSWDLVDPSKSNQLQNQCFHDFADGVRLSTIDLAFLPDKGCTHALTYFLPFILYSQILRHLRSVCRVLGPPISLIKSTVPNLQMRSHFPQSNLSR